MLICFDMKNVKMSAKHIKIHVMMFAKLFVDILITRILIHFYPGCVRR